MEENLRYKWKVKNEMNTQREHTLHTLQMAMKRKIYYTIEYYTHVNKNKLNGIEIKQKKSWLCENCSIRHIEIHVLAPHWYWTNIKSSFFSQGKWEHILFLSHIGVLHRTYNIYKWYGMPYAYIVYVMYICSKSE